MDYYFLLLGFLQGVFEWLPVSSQGIVALTGLLFKPEQAIDCALLLHLGTLLAALIYFRKDFLDIITFKKPRLLVFLIISTIISLIVSLPIYLALDSVVFGSSLLLITGFGLLITALFHKKNKKLNLNSKNLALFAGLLQGLAVLPGLSRSGSTVFALSTSLKNPKKILKLSYLMSVPVGFCASAFLFLKDFSLGLNAWPGFITSFVFGLISLYSIFKLVQKINFFKFVLIFAILCLTSGLIYFLI